MESTPNETALPSNSSAGPTNLTEPNTIPATLGSPASHSDPVPPPPTPSPPASPAVRFELPSTSSAADKHSSANETIPGQTIDSTSALPGTKINGVTLGLRNPFRNAPPALKRRPLPATSEPWLPNSYTAYEPPQIAAYAFIPSPETSNRPSREPPSGGPVRAHPTVGSAEPYIYTGTPVLGSLTEQYALRPVLDVSPPVQNPAFNLISPTKDQFHELKQPHGGEWGQPEDVDIKPTCTLNLVCYRSGASGCKLHQLRCATWARYPSTLDLVAARKKDPKLIISDAEFFHALRDGYRKQMCGFWRRVFFLKTLRGLRLLSYTQNTRPTVVPLDSFVLQEVLYAYNHPSKLSDTDHVWIDWVFKLRQADKRHALEFVEGWNGTRIAIAGTIPLVFSTVVGLAWSIRTGEWQTGFTVAGFILTAGTLLLALLAVVSGIEASGQAATSS